MGDTASGRLKVIEEQDAWFVVREDDPADWLARFEKSDQFPARSWAENLVRLYNHRISGQGDDPPLPPGTRPSSWHPR